MNDTCCCINLPKRLARPARPQLATARDTAVHRLQAALGAVLAVLVIALALAPDAALAAWTQATGTAGIRFVSMSRIGTTLYAGALGGGLYQSTDDGASWSTAFGANFTGWTPNVVSQIGTVLYVGGSNGSAASIAYSTDAGANWSFQTSWGGASSITDIVQMNGATFAAAYGKGVYKSSSNDGTGWVLSNTGMTSQSAVKKFAQAGTDIFIADATNNGSDGVYKSADNGGSWTRLSASPSGNGGAVSNLINHNGALFFAGGSGVWRSTDNGVNWSKVHASNSYAFTRNNATLYLAPTTGLSLLTSTDGTTWTSRSVSGISAGYLQPGAMISGGKLMLNSGDGIWRETDPAPSYALTITTPVNGSVASDSGGISCGTACSGYYAAGASVTLSATADSGYVFSSWGGDCSGTSNPLNLSVTANMSCAATFALANAAPTANSVVITGTAQVGMQLDGSYHYTDADSDAEGVSTFRWVRSNANTGTGGGADLATSLHYTVAAADEGKYVYFCVTPVADTGTSPGTEVCSAAAGPVLADDGDGIAPAAEGGVPSASGSGTGDGNGDNIPDSTQAHVASLPTHSGGAYATIVSVNNRPLVSVSAIAKPADAPTTASAPFGAFTFIATGVGATAEPFELYIPYNPAITGALKKNRNTGSWDNIATSVTHIGTVKTRITFSLTDGGPYDADGQVNGQIQDPVIPVVMAASAIPTLSEWGTLILSSLLAFVAAVSLQRHRRPASRTDS